MLYVVCLPVSDMRDEIRPNHFNSLQWDSEVWNLTAQNRVWPLEKFLLSFYFNITELDYHLLNLQFCIQLQANVWRHTVDIWHTQYFTRRVPMEERSQLLMSSLAALMGACIWTNIANASCYFLKRKRLRTQSNYFAKLEEALITIHTLSNSPRSTSVLGYFYPAITLFVALILYWYFSH